MIPFPRLHIAESALNRIFNALEDKQAPINFLDAPTVPDPAAEGVAIEQATATPPPVNAASPTTETDIANSSALGLTPFDAMAIGGIPPE